MSERSKRYRNGIDGGILDDGRLRILMLGGFFLLVFGMLALRLYYLQLHRGEEHRKVIAGQSIRYIRQPGMRGSIYSADGVLLAGNRISNDLVFYPAEMRRERGKEPLREFMARHAAMLAGILGRNDYPDAKKISRHLRNEPGIALTVFKDLTPRETALAFEALRTMPGADIQRSFIRICPENKLAAALIGYAKKEDPARAADRDKFKYYIPDIIGIEGVEAACDRLPGSAAGLGLRAYPGYSIIQVNNMGYAHRELLGKKEPLPGSDVTLTVDSRAQKLAEKLLLGSVGAMVVIDADNGDIICAASSPGYDLSRYYPLTFEYHNELSSAQHDPRLNRAFNQVYPPGSILKPLIALAFLRNGVNPQETYYCSGSETIGNAAIRCSAHRYAGADMDMESALEKSCNGYMIHHARQLGLSALAGTLHEAGIGQRTELELRNAAGNFPAPQLKKTLYKARWNEFDTALLSIGQGLISVTPLQMALIAGAFANGGTIYVPHLVDHISDANGIILYKRQITASSRINAAPEHFDIIRQGMFRVVNSSGGSGRRARVEGLELYGKTGTAESGSRTNKRNITHFIAFTEYQNRRYAACITIEDGRSGGVTCAPLMAAFFEHYLMGN